MVGSQGWGAGAQGPERKKKRVGRGAGARRRPPPSRTASTAPGSTPSPTRGPPPALQYRFDGPEDAPVLILGPSLGTTWHMWDRQVPELVKQWRIFRFDLPGHGGAPAYPAGSVRDLTDRLLATLDQFGVQRFGY